VPGHLLAKIGDFPRDPDLADLFFQRAPDVAPSASLTENTRRVASGGNSSAPKSHCELCLGIVRQRLGNPAGCSTRDRSRRQCQSRRLGRKIRPLATSNFCGVLDRKRSMTGSISRPQNALMRAGEPGVAQIGGAAGENLLVGGLHMSMGSHHGA